MADKKLEEYPAINEAWKAVRSERIVHPSGMVISRVVRVPTFGVYKRDLEKNAASIFMSEVEKVAVQIKEVDGNEVKVHHTMDFTEGGNDRRYRFIHLAPKERPFVALHELIERMRMKSGESYDKAHAVANKVEKAARLSK
jgi:hypothetical protein